MAGDARPTSKVRKIVARLVGAAVFGVSVWYLADVVATAETLLSQRGAAAVGGSLLFMGIFGIPGLMYALRPEMFSRVDRFESGYRVSFDHEGLQVTHAANLKQTLWQEVERVEIHTNDSGPDGTDFWWAVVARHGVVSYPLGASGAQEALLEMQSRLDGFDNLAVVNATGSTSTARFVAWRRPSHADALPILAGK